MTESAPEIAVVGGGTGSFTLLQGLKEFTPHITAIVNMCDDGGSTGMLRDELGVLPPGDVRQCLVALSESDEIRDLFSFRYPSGSVRFEGQSVGNMILAGLELQRGSFAEAVKVASNVLRITGQVVPVSLNNHTLVMTDGDEIIHGESEIGHRQINSPDAWVALDPPATINPEAEEAIAKADLVVIAPGNLYGSILPIFAVAGFREAISETNAKVVSVSNLVTKPGQTDGWHVVDYVNAHQRYLGEDAIDFVLYNGEPIPVDLLAKYAADGEFPVAADEARFSEVAARAIGGPLVAKQITPQDPNDRAIRRTLIRHDAYQVGRRLMRIHFED